MADMTLKQIEQNNDRERAELVQTLEALRQRLDPTETVQEIAGTLRDTGGTVAKSVAQTARENPVALALVGAGVAWMLMGGKGKDRPAKRQQIAPHDRLELDATDTDWLHDDAGESASRLTDRAADAASTVASKADDLRKQFAKGTEQMTEAARARVVAARQKAWIAATKARHAAGKGLRKGRDGAVSFFDDQPLVAGALALAAGAAVAAALPRTRKEDEWFGETSDRLTAEAQRVFREESERVRAVAASTGQAARKMAEEKADELRSSAKHAVRQAKEELRDAGQTLAEEAKAEARAQGLNGKRA